MDVVVIKEIVMYQFLVIVILILLCDCWLLLLRYGENKTILGRKFYEIPILVSCFFLLLLARVEIMRIEYATPLHFGKGS